MPFAEILEMKDEGQSSCSDLESAVRSTLEERGVLRGIKAQLRLEVLRAIKGEEARRDQVEPKSRGEDFLLEELIREYLQWRGFQVTLESLDLESGRPRGGAAALTPRDALESALGAKTDGNARRVPILYSLVSSARKGASSS